MTYKINGKPARSVSANGATSDGSLLGLGVQEDIKVAVTAWPIVFAAVVARSLRALASYRVERGIRIMVIHSQ
jgi:hypothetical protein